MQGFDPH